MSKKQKVIEMSPEQQKEAGVDHAEELYLDLHRSAALLPEADQETIKKARRTLEESLGLLSSHVPKEPTGDDIVHLTRLVATALLARNTIRECFLRDMGYEMPEETVH